MSMKEETFTASNANNENQPPAEPDITKISQPIPLKFKYSKNQLLDLFKQQDLNSDRQFKVLIQYRGNYFSEQTLYPVNFNPNQKKTGKEINMFSQQRVYNKYQSKHKKEEPLKLTKPFENYKEVTNPTIRIWNYKDDTGKEQGPFTSLEMDWWYHQHYFTPKLMIKLIYMKEYVQLQELLVDRSKSKKMKLKLKISKKKYKPKAKTCNYKPKQGGGRGQEEDVDQELLQQRTQTVKSKGNRFKNFRNRHLKSPNSIPMILEVPLEREQSHELGDKLLEQKPKQPKTLQDTLQGLLATPPSRPLETPPQKQLENLDFSNDYLSPDTKIPIIHAISKEEWNALTKEEKKHRNYLKRQRYKERRRIKKMKARLEKQKLEEMGLSPKEIKEIIKNQLSSNSKSSKKKSGKQHSQNKHSSGKKAKSKYKKFEKDKKRKLSFDQFEVIEKSPMPQNNKKEFQNNLFTFADEDNEEQKLDFKKTYKTQEKQDVWNKPLGSIEKTKKYKIKSDIFLGDSNNSDKGSKGSYKNKKNKSNKSSNFKKKRKASYETYSYFSKKDTGNKSQGGKHRKGSQEVYSKVNHFENTPDHKNNNQQSKKSRKKSYENYHQKVYYVKKEPGNKNQQQKSQKRNRKKSTNSQEDQITHQNKGSQKESGNKSQPREKKERKESLLKTQEGGEIQYDSNLNDLDQMVTSNSTALYTMTSSSENFSLIPGDVQNNQFIEINPQKELQPRWINFITFLLLLMNMIIAILISNIEVVFSLVGAITGNTLGFILPAAIYLKIISDREKLNQPYEKSKFQTMSAWLCIVVGFISMFVSVAANVIKQVT